jgi:hypothetical protein
MFNMHRGWRRQNDTINIGAIQKSLDTLKTGQTEIRPGTSAGFAWFCHGNKLNTRYLRDRIRVTPANQPEARDGKPKR